MTSSAPPPELPSISLVVPNYNGAATLERTLKSILDQNYPKLELIVTDGGSADQSVEIIRRYASRMAWWCSEKDQGQSNAINKGIWHANGEIINWLGSDDTLEPGSLEIIGREFALDPALDVLVGRCRWHDTRTGKERLDNPTWKGLNALPAGVPIGQPSCFYKRRLLRPDFPIDESYHYVMDLELWAYFKSRNVRWKIIENVLSTFEMNGMNKTSTGGDKVVAEMERVYNSYRHEMIPMTWWLRHLAYPLDKWRGSHPGKISNLATKGMKLTLYAILAPFYGWSRLRAMNYSALVPNNSSDTDG